MIVYVSVILKKSTNKGLMTYEHSFSNFKGEYSFSNNQFVEN